MDPAQGGIAAGTVLVGKYRVDAVLGQGGMGMVYRAQHLALNEPVAMKVLRRDVSLDEDTVTRFVREAQAAVKLKSEHVARIQDVGTFEDGLPYMVMEYLEGADLGQLLEQNGAMYPAIAIDLLLQACDAISEAHSLGIVHRDIKPTNLFVSFRPDQTAIVKVLDFGISKSANAQDLSLTQTQSMLGTPAYMSPEQMRSARSVDARTDIWSLGTVLYELVENRRPFQAESFSEMCVMVAIDPPSPLINAPELGDVIGKCLAKDQDQRYANVAELMRDLAPFANNPDAARYYCTRAARVLGLAPQYDSSPAIPRYVAGAGSSPAPLPISALTMHSPAGTAAPTLSTVDGPTHVDPLPIRSRRGVWIGAIVTLLLGGAAAAAYVVTSREPAVREQQIVEPEPTGSAPLPPVEPVRVVDRTATADPAGSGSATLEAGSGSSARTVPATKPNVRPRPPIARAKPPVVTKPAVVETPKPPPPTKPKCDPFGARTVNDDCKS